MQVKFGCPLNKDWEQIQMQVKFKLTLTYRTEQFEDLEHMTKE